MEATKIDREKDQGATVRKKTKPTQLQMIYQIPILSVTRDQHSGSGTSNPNRRLYMHIEC
jgi:hypothetical protein